MLYLKMAFKLLNCRGSWCQSEAFALNRTFTNITNLFLFGNFFFKSFSPVNNLMAILTSM